ncbi:MAG TPA: hypothetical protein VGA69_04820 [Nitriliruptorales bacterium]
MTARPDPLRVLLLAHGEAAADLEGALEGLACDVVLVGDVFEGMAQATDVVPDAVVLDLTMARDDARVLAYWLRDQDLPATVIGIVEPLNGAAQSDLDDLCDELVLAPATAEALAPALGIDPPPSDQHRKLTVKVNAALLDAHEVQVPPEAAATHEGDKPALIVGLGAHAEAPRYND